MTFTRSHQGLRVTDLDTEVTEDENTDAFSLSKHFSEQIPLIQFNFLMYFPYCAGKQYLFSIFHFYNIEIHWQ